MAFQLARWFPEGSIAIRVSRRLFCCARFSGAGSWWMQNIQQLFAIIPLRRVKLYLERNGWRQAPHADPRVTQYGSPDREGAEPCKVLLVESEEHPAYRRYLPNLIFAVSVFEDRPAYDIALELAEREAEESTARGAGAAGASVLAADGVAEASSKLGAGTASGASAVSSDSPAIVMWHANIGQTHVWLNSLENSFPWRRGDRLEIRGGSGPAPVVSIRDDAVLIRRESSSTARVFLATPVEDANALEVIRGLVAEACESLTAFDLECSADELNEALERALRRIAFDLAGEESQIARPVVRRVIALVITAFAQRLNSNSGTVELLWRVAQRIAGLAGLALEVTPRAAEELAVVASGDSEESPFRTVSYLERLVVAH